MSEPFLGEIRLVSFNFPPKGWALCNGQLLPINQNTALFSLLGTMYGGNGVQTFALPNLQGRTAMHRGATTQQGQQGGDQAVTLTQDQLPPHTHALNGTSDFANASAPGLALPAAKPRGGLTRYGTSGSSNAPMHPSSLSIAGANQSHDNNQPYQVLNHVIALQGIFPARD